MPDVGCLIEIKKAEVKPKWKMREHCCASSHGRQSTVPHSTQVWTEHSSVTLTLLARPELRNTFNRTTGSVTTHRQFCKEAFLLPRVFVRVYLAVPISSISTLLLVVRYSYTQHYISDLSYMLSWPTWALNRETGRAGGYLYWTQHSWWDPAWGQRFHLSGPRRKNRGWHETNTNWTH